MKFRPCIDLREGKVVQIVGGTLKDDSDAGLQVNFSSSRSAEDYARLYLSDRLSGGHVIALGPGNRETALAALQAYPGGLQYGGGVTPENAQDYLVAGASHVIVTSYIFRDGRLDRERLEQLSEVTGKQRLVLDLSCRKRDGDYWVVTDRWQRFTDAKVDALLLTLSEYCDEFLVHGVDVEGQMQGVETGLVELLAAHSPLPVTYAGGVTSLEDLELIRSIGRGQVDVTVGSALDIFGGPVSYTSVLEWQRRTLAAEVP